MVLFQCNSVEELGRRIQVAESSLKGFELNKTAGFRYDFFDLRMPEMDGVELFHQIKANKPKLPVAIITGYHDSDMMASALAQGPFVVMNKPFGTSDIVNATKVFLRMTN
jgi:DNA-binding NtrC family response regulator